MTKTKYVAEIISEELEHYSITPELIEGLAEGIVHGLDMWYEFSGDSVASSNRYAAIESEKQQAIKSAQKELENEQKRHSDEMEEANRNVRWMRARYQQQIEELQKQVR